MSSWFRDEEWLVTFVDESSDGPIPQVQGLSDLVRGRDAVFYPSLDRGIRLIELPRSHRPRRQLTQVRSWGLRVESTLGKSAVTTSDDPLRG